MRHYVLTRSAYGPAWDLEANRRRLAITAAITVRSMAAQSVRDWAWIVALDPRDPLIAERRAAFAEAGVPVSFVEFDTGPLGRSAAGYAAYRADWSAAIGPRRDAVAMTRLDDDDAFTPDALARIQRATSRGTARRALLFPVGYRVWGQGYTEVWHASNAMHTLVTPAGDSATVYDYGHRYVRRFAPALFVDRRAAWLWVRHPDTISGWRVAAKPITPAIRRLFPIDWDVFLDGPPPQARRGVASGRHFR